MLQEGPLSVGFNGHGVTRAADLALGKQIMEILVSHYPLHNWGVEVNHEAGHIVIRLIYKDFEGNVRVANHGVVFFIHKLSGEQDLRYKVIRAGGEWLERYGIPRGKATPEAIMDAKRNKLDLAV